MAWDNINNPTTTALDEAGDDPSLARAQLYELANIVASILDERGAPDGVCDLDGGSRVPAGRLPTITNAIHGNRGGGALHATAVAGGAAGFLPGGDKQKLDSLYSSVSVWSSGPASPVNVSSLSTAGEGWYLVGINSGSVGDWFPIYYRPGELSHGASYASSAGGPSLYLTNVRVSSVGDFMVTRHLYDFSSAPAYHEQTDLDIYNIRKLY